jgi:hypothetical protein
VWDIDWRLMYLKIGISGGKKQGGQYTQCED